MNVDNNKDYTIEEVKTICKEYGKSFEAFEKWFCGKTGIIDKDGNRCVFGYDINKFLGE